MRAHRCLGLEEDQSAALPFAARPAALVPPHPQRPPAVPQVLDPTDLAAWTLIDSAPQSGHACSLAPGHDLASNVTVVLLFLPQLLRDRHDPEPGYRPNSNFVASPMLVAPSALIRHQPPAEPRALRPHDAPITLEREERYKLHGCRYSKT